jgi:predicted nucleic acid-binding protein
MSGFLIDSNVLLDVATFDGAWHEWSEAQLAKASGQGLAFINPIIYAELAPEFPSQGAMDLWLDSGNFQRLPLPYQAGWRAGQAFVQYRRAGRVRTSPMPDFYIGAHAESSGLTLVTRDTSRYATYFPQVALVTP